MMHLEVLQLGILQTMALYLTMINRLIISYLRLKNSCRQLLLNSLLLLLPLTLPAGGSTACHVTGGRQQE
uniref:Putative product n=1 Tax=Xenopsylla cheopis TaxID=163159 RepID=A0A6M2DX14_XENCH